MPDLHVPGTAFEIGKAITLATGSDITFIATGVISMHTIKPLGGAGHIDMDHSPGAMFDDEEEKDHPEEQGIGLHKIAGPDV